MSNSIKNLIATKCACYGGNYYYRNHNNGTVCSELDRKLNKMLKFDQKFKTNMLTYITNNYNCIYTISEKNFDKLFLDDAEFAEKNVKKIETFYSTLQNNSTNYYYDAGYKPVQNIKNIHNVLKYWSTKNILLNDEKLKQFKSPLFVNNFRSQGNYYNDPVVNEDKYKNFIEFILNHVTKENIYSFIVSRWETYYTILVEKMSEKNIECNQKMLYEALKYLDYSKYFVEFLLKNGCIIDSKCLEIVCEYGEIDTIRYVLDYRIIPETKHFLKLFKAKNFIGIQYGSYYYRQKEVDDAGYTYEGSGYSKQKFELLSTHGYRLTRDDLKESIKTKCEIPNINKFNLTLDKEILDLCDEKDFFPSYEFTCISKEMMELRDLCAKGGLPPVRNYLKKTNIVPDIVCIKNACKLKANYAVVNLLLEKGAKLNDDCLKYTCENITTGYKMLKLVIDNYIDDKNDKIRVLEERIKKLESGENATENEKKEELISESDSENEGEEGEEGEGEGREKEAIEENKEVSSANIITISDDLIGKIPKQKRRNLKIPKKYADYFKEKNNKLMSFITLRKELLQRMKDEEWIDKNNKQLINIPDSLAKELNIDKGQLKFDDIDKFVGLFYN